MERDTVEQQDLSSKLLPSRWDAADSFLVKPHDEKKKFRLFGFEVDPYTNGGSCSRSGSVNSSSNSAFSQREKKPVKRK